MWSDNTDAAASIPKDPSEVELELVQQVRDRIHNLCLSDNYLQAKNLVRFIRARSGSLNQAELMIRKNVEWISEERIDIIFDWPIPPAFEKWFPWKVCGVDDFGGPIFVIHAGCWEPANLSGMKNELVRYFLLIMEKGRRFLAAGGSNCDFIPQFSVIIDCEGLGWKHYLSYDGIQAVIIVLRYLEANYPDSLRLVVAVNCPSVLNMIWKIVKPFVSPATQAKLRFLYQDDKQVWRDMLIAYFPEDRFPEKYGGTLPDSYKIPLESERPSRKGGYRDENGNN